MGWIGLLSGPIQPFFFMSKILNLERPGTGTANMTAIPGQIINLRIEIQGLQQAFASGPSIQDIIDRIIVNITDLDTPAITTYDQLLILRDRIQSIEIIEDRRQARMKLTTFIQTLRNFLNWYWDLPQTDRHLVNYLGL
jgi:hypothetical protein